ncbi:MAG: hypothetical protein EOR05_31550 [Mesorhizobium sp.]|nr:MAG: hypothetical protein EOR05_31550 [Mesorhizobium sp.]
MEHKENIAGGLSSSADDRQGNRFRFALPLVCLRSSVGGWRKPKRHPISPLRGMSGRTEGWEGSPTLDLTRSQPEISLRAWL